MKNCIEGEDSIIDVFDQDFQDQDEGHDVKNKYKVYTEKPYFNSDKDPFGVTLNGKTKDYLRGHEVIKNLIITGKKNFVEEERIRIVEATHKKGMVIGIIEVASKSESDKGNAELKV